MSRLLLVSYYFPPLGGVGSQRALRFARYLPDFGWQVTVVTPRTSDYALRDALTTKRDHGYRVVRTPAMDVPRRVPCMHRWISRNVLFPDERAIWGLLSGSHVLRLAKECDVVMSTSPPVTTHVLACRAARAAGVPWIADFRDPYMPPVDASQGRVRRHERLERQLLSAADAITVTSPTTQSDFAARTSAPVHTVLNGYDPEELLGIEAARLPGGFTVLHVGSLYGQRSISPTLEALEIVVRRVPELRSLLRMHFVGRVDAAERQRAIQSRVADIVSFTGFVPREQALALMLGADALLLVVAPEHAHAIPAKLYDYLACRVPVLALAPEGDAARIVREAGGVVAHTPADLADELARMRTLPRIKTDEGPRGRQQYEAEAVTARMAQVLSGVLRLRVRDEG